MNRKECVIFITASLLFTSCSTRALRSDIKEFIASFSFDEAVKTHTSGGYSSIRNHNVNGYVYKENITLDFSYEDSENITYDYLQIVTHDDIEMLRVHNYLVYEEGTLYYVSSDGKEEYDLQKSTELIKHFFYESYNQDGDYHSRGMYYGDFISEMATTYQDYIVIDNENKQLRYTYETSGKGDDGQNQHLKEVIIVDHIGMLVSLSFEGENGSLYSYQLISVY